MKLKLGDSVRVNYSKTGVVYEIMEFRGMYVFLRNDKREYWELLEVLTKVKRKVIK